MEYITLHSNQAAYDAVKDSLPTPQVALIQDSMTVNYKPYVSLIIDGHEYVDLGLPSGTKWATMNVGATGVTDYGNYYGYGQGDEQYNSDIMYYDGKENPLATNVDTAAQVWGGQWHMPTSGQCQELIDNTTFEWATINGTNGGKFTSTNGNYVFFPAGGNLYMDDKNLIGSYACYWTSTPYGTRGLYAYFLRFDNGGLLDITNIERESGLSIRPVVG